MEKESTLSIMDKMVKENNQGVMLSTTITDVKFTDMNNKTLLVIAPSQGRDCVFNILVAETGEHLASHFCSNEGFAYGDLYATREERKEEWGKRFGELEVKYLNETEITEEQLLARNKDWYDKQPKKAE